MLFSCLDESNIRYLKVKENVRIPLNDLNNILDVGQFMWDLIKKHSEAIVYSNIVKSKKLKQFMDNIEPSLHRVFENQKAFLKNFYKSCPWSYR